ncbi:MAG: hypothetical protein IH591_10950 [Bacteroidales bacterium]|nr:hypothetical protein [Bacteroidales bacterium]
MVLKSSHIKIALVVLLFSVVTSSCEKEMFVLVDCASCTADEPSSASVKVKIYPDPGIFSDVSVFVYEGDEAIGEPIAEYRYNIATSFDIDLSLNRIYTFVAIYVSDGKTYRAVDSLRPSVKYTESQCDEACYFVYNNKVNLRLKYL